VWIDGSWVRVLFVVGGGVGFFCLPQKGAPKFVFLKKKKKGGGGGVGYVGCCVCVGVDRWVVGAGAFEGGEEEGGVETPVDR
jgi:hypothetical protein